ncbi:CMGC family protein kinase [Tritrichomonas foetus]|uniref:dual-specificity kinase n=1 Tax=Tritrichomonas foetus TaxID=1144522 RepID=A0A1J4K4Q2_9EUKA|nr:CMGC family protein kinase [Tritrichomonas foetus]|eukprot:OHT06171.1 CMGC family protein kinase [Tritrichomonas foetus]
MLVNKFAMAPLSARKERIRATMEDNKKPLQPRQPSVPRVNLNIINDENSIRPVTPKGEPISSRRSNPRFSRGSARPSTTINPVVPNGPITPHEARQQYAPLLNSYEQKEIDDYPEIYFLGQINKKIRPTNSNSNNHGYDDSSSHYRAIVGDHIAYRYEIRAILGKGAFGQVIRCFDHKTKQSVALKLIVNTEIMQEQGRIEVAIIQHLNNHDPDKKQHVIRGLDYFIFRRHICATFEILGQNMYEYSRSMRFRPISSPTMKPIAQQILQGLAFCHSNNVVHCDMKPENILLLPGGFKSVKIIDFGSSCFVGHQRYEYIQSRFYRAPEVILGIKYGPPMDIWSFGCIIIEMMIGKPIFPGNDEHEQLEMLMEVFGAPPNEILQQCSRRHEFFTNEGKLRPPKERRRRRPVGSTTLQQLTHIPDSLLIDLLSKCFEWDQKKRITASDALNHPWFTTKEIQTNKVQSHILPELIR